MIALLGFCVLLIIAQWMEIVSLEKQVKQTRLETREAWLARAKDRQRGSNGPVVESNANTTVKSREYQPANRIRSFYE